MKIKSNETAPYQVKISFTHGEGFSVSVSVPGEHRDAQNAFISLEKACAFADKVLSRAGFTTKES